MIKPIMFPFDTSLDMTRYTPVQISDSNYTYDGITVPRVTHILSMMLHDDYLVPWSNAMGLYNHLKYDDIMKKATDIGSIVHESIERYLQTGVVLEVDAVPPKYRFEIINAFSAFIDWWSIINTHNWRIIMEEETLTCKYYGGTLDLLLEIDGKIYLIDFKTSNHLSYKYFLQLAAYRRMLFYERGISIDGCILLQLSKKDKKFNEVVLNLNNEIDFNYMRQCDSMFMTLVYGYYQRQVIENTAISIINKGGNK